jgi:hydrogenase expression/formation protein HypC
MCIGIPGRLVEMTNRTDVARVDVEGVVRDINVGLLAPDLPGPGEWVMIHLGFALERMTDEEAQAALQTMTDLGEGEFPDHFMVEEDWSDDEDPFARVPPAPAATPMEAVP